jgi:hypothetical protein
MGNEGRKYFKRVGGWGEGVRRLGWVELDLIVGEVRE